MVSETLYRDCIEFAKKEVRFRKCNADPIDLVHDLIAYGEIDEPNYKKKIISSIIGEAHKVRPLEISAKKPFKTNCDFYCKYCDSVLPNSESYVSFSEAIGGYIQTNMCITCNGRPLKELYPISYYKWLETSKIRYANNREALSDNYIIELLSKKKPKSAITPQMIIDKRNAIIKAKQKPSPYANFVKNRHLAPFAHINQKN